MGSNQLYSLTWGDFGTSLVSTVQLLRCRGDLVDVTLAAGGRSFPAHKIVLCAASPLLLDLLKSTPCKHPVVMLAGVTAPDLEALLEFVYRGEVSIDPNQLPSLLQAAHCLNIQGLAPGTIAAEKPDDLSVTIPSTHEALTRDVINSFLPIRRRKRCKRRNSTGSGSGSGGKWSRQDVSTDTENRPLDQHCVTSDQDVLGSMANMTAKSEEVDDKPQLGADDQAAVATCSGGGKMRAASEQPGVCPLCGATLRQARNLRRHLLTSCKYRMMNPPLATTAALPLPADLEDSSNSLSRLSYVPMQPSIGSVSLESSLLLEGNTCKKNSVSDQPATCPLCGATLRQSRNLRRHLELLHFGAGRSMVKVRTRKSSTTSSTLSQQQQLTTSAVDNPIQDSRVPSTSQTPPLSLASTIVQTQEMHISSPTTSHPNLVLPVSMPQMSHVMGPPHCQNQGHHPHLRHEELHIPQERVVGGLCEPSPVLGCMLPAMSSPHDPLFRQHHTDLLRGAGLYAETRIPSRAPDNPNLRQGVA
ncbi:unnamed protein product [Timema podura]|uniref:Transcription factor GAGA n=1 Tax=Timema podura TaxID=61482 RepID=A0ABN7NJR1_TIMPD|nr:unnamed protein product [Timema podura]